MQNNEQHLSKSGSFRARAMSSAAQPGPVFPSFRHAGPVPSGDQVIVEKGVKNTDFSLDMTCTSHHYYG